MVDRFRSGAVLEKLDLVILALVLITSGTIYASSKRATSTVFDNPNAVGTDGYPIIFQVIASRDLNSVKRLVDAGADIEARGFTNATPVLMAAISRSWHICRFFLEHGADPTAVTTSGFTLPYLAANTTVAPESKPGRDLAAVRAIITTRGLDYLALPPREVKKLVSAKRWPPPR